MCKSMSADVLSFSLRMVLLSINHSVDLPIIQSLKPAQSTCCKYAGSTQIRYLKHVGYGPLAAPVILWFTLSCSYNLVAKQFFIV